LPISVSKVPGSRDERVTNPRLGRGDRFHHDVEHGRVLAGQDRLAFQPGADGTVDGRAAAAWLARADDGAPANTMPCTAAALAAITGGAAFSLDGW
jgi:hypothetical protein